MKKLRIQFRAVSLVRAVTGLFRAATVRERTCHRLFRAATVRERTWHRLFRAATVRERTCHRLFRAATACLGVPARRQVRERARPGRRFRYNATLGLIAISTPALPGCIEIQALLSGSFPTDSVPGGSNGDDGFPGNGGTPQGAPAVTLRVSNPSPGLNETVFLTCTRVSGGTSGLSFSFQPETSRLSVNQSAGTASITVSEPDIGTEFIFTCTAVNDFGTSGPSNRVSVIPTG